MSIAAMLYRLLVACSVSKIETVSLEGTMHIVFVVAFCVFVFCFLSRQEKKMYKSCLEPTLRLRFPFATSLLRLPQLSPSY